MGHVRVPVEIANPFQPERWVRFEGALIDTGARTTIPRALANELDLEVVERSEVRTADGIHSLDLSHAMIRLQDKRTYGDIWISDDYPGVLIGVITLESLGLAVDARGNRLIPTEFLLL
jgi:predicted aspartyl protease